MDFDPATLKYDADGLIPAIAQEAGTLSVSVYCQSLVCLLTTVDYLYHFVTSCKQKRMQVADLVQFTV